MPDQWWGVFAIWRGGLGVWGGIALGCLVGGIVAKRAGANVVAPRRLSRARPAARAGNRAPRELVEPGALRQADRPAVGARDRRAAVPVRAGNDLPPDLPLRADLGLRDGGRARLPDRTAPPPAAARRVRRVHRPLLHRPLLRGAPADRPGTPHRRAAPERVGVADRHRRRRGLVRPLAAQRPARAAREEEGEALRAGSQDGRPAGQARPTPG